MEGGKLSMGCRVLLTDRNLDGVVAFIGTTQFSTGKWIGVILDEPQGKNNGTVQGKRYFTCDDNYGIFVRPTQLALIGPTGTIPILDSSLTSNSSESTVGGSQKGTPSRPPVTGIQTSKGSVDTAPESSDSKNYISLQEKFSDPNTVNPLSTALSQSDLSQIVQPEAHIASEKKAPLQLQPPTVLSGIPRPVEHPKQPPPATPVIVPVKSESSKVSVPAKLNSELHRESTLPSADCLLEMENLRAEVKDLNEKLEVLKSKRAEDRIKLKDVESMRLQLTQLEENRRLMQENSADLQRQLAQAKNEASLMQAAYDRYREEMTDVAESIEMATLDKEMAEEKLETLVLEMDALKERVEELSLENQILKEEKEVPVDASGDGAPTLAQMKQLEQQNERIKLGLVTFRNLVNQDKQEIATLTKEISSLTAEVDRLKNERNRMEEELKQSLEHTIELKEQVDASLGADHMVSVLTRKNQELEEKLEKAIEDRSDLETLCNTNDELFEVQRETELELREQLELVRSQVQEFARQHEASRETVADYELTLSKFRELVTDLQTQNTNLAQSVADARRNNASQSNLAAMSEKLSVQTPVVDATALMSSFTGSRQPEAQTIAKVIETELRRLEADQGALHVKLLSGFLPESFSRRAGDHDAILLILLVDRLIVKCELLSTQVRKRYPLPQGIHGLPPGPEMLMQTPSRTVSKSDQSGVIVTVPDVDEQQILLNRGEFYSFTSFLILLLQYWQGLLQQLKCLLSTGTVDFFSKMVTLYHDLSSGHENCLDHLLDLCKRDQLDESFSLEPLLLSVNYFVSVQSVHLTPVMQSNNVPDSSMLMSNFARILLAGTEALAVDASCIAVFTAQPLEELDIEGQCDNSETSNQRRSALAALLIKICQSSASLRSKARSIRRRIPSNTESQPLSINTAVATSLEDALHKLILSARCMFTTIKNTGQLIATQMAEASGVDSSAVLKECLNPAVKLILSDSEFSMGNKCDPDFCLSSLMDGVVSVVATVATAMENGEYDFDGTRSSKSQEPILLRSIAHRRAQTELESCKAKLELKDEEVRELHVSLKARADELSEMAVRVSMAEKKLETSGKGSLETIVRLEQRLQQSVSDKKRIEKEYEQALDALQNSVITMEKENSELKEKLRTNSKKGVFDSLIKSPGLRSPSLSESVGNTKLSSYRDSTFMLNEIESLREALTHLSSDNVRLLGSSMHDKISSWKPLHVPYRSARMKLNPKSDETMPRIPTTSSLADLCNRIELSVKNYYTVLATPKLVKLPKIGEIDGEIIQPPAFQLASQTNRLLQAKNQMIKLQDELISHIKSNSEFAPIRADFANFVSSRTIRKLGLTDLISSSTRLGRLTLPRSCALTAAINEYPKPVFVSSNEVKSIISAILS